MGLVWQADAKKAIGQVSAASLPAGLNQSSGYVMEADELFKEAVECPITGEPQVDIDRIAKGLKIYETNNGLVPEAILLRRPNYLRAVGRNQEAWDE